MNWWITVGVEYPDSITTPQNKGVGIDLGIKDLVICSDGNKYKNINKHHEIKQLEKKKNADYSVQSLVLMRKIKKERNTVKLIM